MKEIEVKIDEEIFYINIEEAKKSGLLRKPLIKSFQVGDLFITENKGVIIIAPRGYRTGRYSMAGLTGFNIYSNLDKSYVEMLDHLNQPHVNAKFIKNINNDVDILVKKFIAQNNS